MAMLHIINKSPFEHSALDSCLRLAKKGSGILFIEDGTYAVQSGTAAADKLKAAMGDHSVYALGADMDARGLPEEKMLSSVSRVDYAGFVQLTTEFDTVKSWL